MSDTTLIPSLASICFVSCKSTQALWSFFIFSLLTACCRTETVLELVYLDVVGHDCKIQSYTRHTLLSRRGTLTLVLEALISFPSLFCFRVLFVRRWRFRLPRSFFLWLTNLLSMIRLFCCSYYWHRLGWRHKIWNTSNRYIKSRRRHWRAAIVSPSISHLHTFAEHPESSRQNLSLVVVYWIPDGTLVPCVLGFLLCDVFFIPRPVWLWTPYWNILVLPASRVPAFFPLVLGNISALQCLVSPRVALLVLRSVWVINSVSRRGKS